MHIWSIRQFLLPFQHLPPSHLPAFVSLIDIHSLFLSFPPPKLPSSIQILSVVSSTLLLNLNNWLYAWYYLFLDQFYIAGQVQLAGSIPINIWPFIMVYFVRTPYILFSRANGASYSFSFFSFLIRWLLIQSLILKSYKGLVGCHYPEHKFILTSLNMSTIPAINVGPQNIQLHHQFHHGKHNLCLAPQPFVMHVPHLILLHFPGGSDISTTIWWATWRWIWANWWAQIIIWPSQFPSQALYWYSKVNGRFASAFRYQDNCQSKG